MKRLSSSTFLTALAIAGVCSVLAIGAGTALGQDTASGNNTYDSLQETQQAADFEFGTPSYVPSNVSFDSGLVQDTEIPVVRLFWTGGGQSNHLSIHTNPRQSGNLFRGNDQIESAENLSINGQPGDYQRPRTIEETPTLTFVSGNDTVYIISGTYNRSTLVRVAESIGTADSSAPTSTAASSGTTDTTPLANTLTIKSTGEERVYYNATASEGMKPAAGADLSGAESPDSVDENRASGSTAQNGRDNFTFAGELTGLTIDGDPARVLVNGDEVDPESYSTVTPTPTSTPTATSTPTPTATSTPTPTATETSAATDTPISTTGTTSSTTPASTPVNESSSNGSLVDSETANGSGTNSSGSGPGFGIVAAALAILGSTYLVRRRA